jgi:hypothetical protein
LRECLQRNDKLQKAAEVQAQATLVELGTHRCKQRLLALR